MQLVRATRANRTLQVAALMLRVLPPKRAKFVVRVDGKYALV